MVRHTRFELVTTRLKVVCSTNWANDANGVTDEARTRDNQCHKLALYQLNYGHHIYLERETRFELATFSLEGWRSTNWAIPASLNYIIIIILLCQLFFIGGDDQIRTGDGDFADLCLTAWRRRHLFKINGAQRRNRTTDTGIFSPLLYRLSYLGIILLWRKARDSNSKVLRRRFSRPVPYQLG